MTSLLRKRDTHGRRTSLKETSAYMVGAARIQRVAMTPRVSAPAMATTLGARRPTETARTRPVLRVLVVIGTPTRALPIVDVAAKDILLEEIDQGAMWRCESDGQAALYSSRAGGGRGEGVGCAERMAVMRGGA